MMDRSTSSNSVLRFLRSALPLSVRASLRKIHQRIVFKRAIQSFRLHYHDLTDHPTLVDDLVYGWGNLGWSSFQDYSRAIIHATQTNKGPVLECGSGLSTVLMGIIAQDKGCKVYSLEHHEEWKKHVEDQLAKLGITSVTVCHTPLKNYGSFSWYDVSNLSHPSDFSLVICDGPPHDTDGGRYGLLPVMATHFADKALILLDDYVRPDEQAVVTHWQQDYKLLVEAVGEHDRYARIEFSK